MIARLIAAGSATYCVEAPVEICAMTALSLVHGPAGTPACATIVPGSRWEVHGADEVGVSQGPERGVSKAVRRSSAPMLDLNDEPRRGQIAPFEPPGA